jgi:hypothetical protein
MLRLPTHFVASDRLSLKLGGGIFLLLVAGLPAAGLLFPAAQFDQTLLVLIGLAVAVAGAFAALRAPGLGFFALVVVALTFNIELETGTQTLVSGALLISTFLVIAWGLSRLAQKRNPEQVRLRLFLAAGLFCGIAVLSTIVGQYPWFAVAGAPLPAQLGGLAIFLLSAGILCAASQQLTSASLKHIVLLFLFLGVLNVLWWVLPVPERFSEILAPAGGMGAVFWTWYVAMGTSQALLNRELRPVWRLVIGCMTLGAIYVGLVHMLDWSSGWVPGLLAIWVICLLWAPARTCLVSVVLGALVLYNLDKFVPLIMNEGQSYSLMTRIEAMRNLIPVVSADPILGLGPANYYHYTRLFPIMGWYVNFNSHNNYVDILAQTGIVGLAAFLWLVFEVGRTGWRLCQRAKAGFSQAYAYGALGGLAGTLAAGMLGDWFLPFVYNVGLRGFRSSVLAWLFLGGLIALERETA